jgi:DNA-directed RNA polymerase specialized sigma24 family protein
MLDIAAIRGDSGLWACARHWAGRLAHARISGYSEEDLVQEAICRLLNREQQTDDDEVRDPVAFCCRTIQFFALGKMREQKRHATEATDPNDGVLAWVPSAEIDFVEARIQWLAKQTMRHMDLHRVEIWERAVDCLGPNHRAAGIWVAATQATEQLLLGVAGLSLRETLTSCLTRADEWWREDDLDDREPDTVRRAAERRTKRVNRDLPWVSYVALWEGLLWAYHGEQSGLTREIARCHRSYVAALLRDRTEGPSRVALERHLAEVAGVLQPFGWPSVTHRIDNPHDRLT